MSWSNDLLVNPQTKQSRKRASPQITAHILKVPKWNGTNYLIFQPEFAGFPM